MEEVDLDLLNFDEERYENQWAYKTELARTLSPTSTVRNNKHAPQHHDREQVAFLDKEREVGKRTRYIVL